MFRWICLALTALFAAAIGQPALAQAQEAQAQVAAQAAVTATVASSADADAKQHCVALLGGAFAGIPGAPTWITDASYHPQTSARRAFCEVQGYINPQVRIGMYLPVTGWNGRFLVRGCGGSCGQIVWLEGACGKHVRDGFACIFTDMGHFSSQIDNNWVANNLQGQIDFGYRATHVTTVVGKRIAAAFYGKDPHHSYYLGCSTGGRQGLVEAQRFPADFDGLFVAAPAASNFGTVLPSIAKINTGADGHAILTDRQVPLIYKAAMAECDAKDGIRDGIVQAGDCRFDPVSLLCRPGQSPAAGRCLSQPQVDVARAFYQRGARYGSELNWITNWTAEPHPPTEFAQSRGDPDIVDTFNNAGNPDLSALRDRGTKMILVHGSTDLVVTPYFTDRYYDTVIRTMGGLDETQKFFRYFIINGMDHCSGGDGAWGVNYLPLLVDWVENGKAPERIVGIHPKEGVELDYFGIESDTLTPDQIAFSRPYYPYPMKAYYAGGDATRADSFKPGMKPLGKLARNEPSSLRGSDAPALAAELVRIAGATEKAYLAAGLPDKNVADRVGKKLRFEIYNSGKPDALLRDALAAIDMAGQSAVIRSALSTVRPEFGLPAAG